MGRTVVFSHAAPMGQGAATNQAPTTTGCAKTHPQAAPPKEQPGQNKGKSKKKRKQAQPPAHMEREVKRTPSGDFTGVEAEMLKKHEEAEEAARLKALETADTLEAIKAVPPTRRGTYNSGD